MLPFLFIIIYKNNKIPQKWQQLLFHYLIFLYAEKAFINAVILMLKYLTTEKVSTFYLLSINQALTTTVILSKNKTGKRLL